MAAPWTPRTGVWKRRAWRKGNHHADGRRIALISGERPVKGPFLLETWQKAGFGCKRGKNGRLKKN